MPFQDAPPIVLVIDDAGDQTRGVAHTLRAGGFEVLEADSVAHAVELAARAQVDVVVLNAWRPAADEFEVSRSLKQATSGVLPIMHLSSQSAASAARLAGLEFGADGYLLHPFDSAELCAAVGALARLKRNEVARAAHVMANALLHEALDTLADHVALLAPNGDVLAVNQAWVDFAAANGYWNGGSGLGTNYPDVCECASGAGAEEARAAAIGIRHVLTGVRDTFTLNYPCHSPTAERWFRMSVRRVARPGTVAAIVTHADRTDEQVAANIAMAERDKADAAHASRASEEALFRALTEQSREFISILEPDGRFRYVSPSVQRTLGYTPDELLGTYPVDFVHDEDRATMLATYFALSHGGPGMVAEMTVRLRHKDGSWRHFEGGGQNLLHDPAVRGITSNARDVTARVEAERATQIAAQERERLVTSLGQSEQRLRAQFMKLPVATFLWEARGDDFVLVELNDAAERLMMPLWADAVGRTATDLFPAGWPVRDDIVQCVRDGVVVRRSIAYEFGPGEEPRTFDLTIGPQLPDRVIVHAIETTEQTRLANQLRQAQRMEAVGQLAGGVAHDFNNLLTVIGAHTTFLLEGFSPNDPRCVDARAIREASGRAAALTRQLLAFSRKQILTPAVVDLNIVVEDTHRMLGRLLGEDIEIVERRAPNLGLVLVDVGQIEQVLMNVVLNARDAMPQGGRLTIATREVTVAADSSFLRGIVPVGHYVVLSVADTGVGMDAATKARVFEPFFTTKEVGKGTGLGLSTVFGIVSQSGGYITVESAPGEGATFDVYFPVVRPGDALEPSLGDPHPQRGGETVLLVEDDPAVRHIAKRVLVREGYHVLEAADGRAALALSASHDGPIDAVITDAVMPGMTGVVVLDQMRIDRPNCKAILMSGYTDDEMTRRGISTSDVTFVQKPFTPADFARQVRQALDS